MGVKGISDAARELAFGNEPLPVISGNVSLYNVTKNGPIDPTANVCIIGVLPDARKSITMQLQHGGSRLYLIGKRLDECGGSAYYQILASLLTRSTSEFLGVHVPHPNIHDASREISLVAASIQQGLIASAHDISEGGLALALVEMTMPQRGISRNIGVSIQLDFLDASLRSDVALFSETGGFILEVTEENADAFEAAVQRSGCLCQVIGKTMVNSTAYTVRRGDTTLIELDIRAMHERSRSTLEATLGSA